MSVYDILLRRASVQPLYFSVQRVMFNLYTQFALNGKLYWMSADTRCVFECSVCVCVCGDLPDGEASGSFRASVAQRLIVVEHAPAIDCQGE